MHRFFIEKEALQDKKVVITSPAARQISDVLHLRPGEKIIVLDNTGMEYTVTLSDVSRRQVSGQITAFQKCQSEPQIKITLFQALTVREKFEHILQKCTEVGVVRFVPVITQRSIVRSGGKITEEKSQRRQAIITEAAEQSGRGVIPRLERPVSLDNAVDYPEKFDLKLVGSTADDAMPLKQILHNGETVGQAPPYIKSTMGQADSDNTVNIALFIGPEGGFSDSEIQLLQSKGAVAFTLGRRILRTETASPVAAAIILYELQD
jgi:16S rRNA (uracil1498-N3)-methyltransferase